MIPFILAELPEKVGTYYEPFLGGGAVFLALARGGRLKKAILNDSNPDLMNAWVVVQSDVDDLIKELRNGKYAYDRATYARIRAESPSAPVERAARTVYLNKTCFNGLWRVNLDGRFNVPFGDYKDPVICDEENLRAVSETLKGTTLLCGPYESALSPVAGRKAKRGDTVYLDPPYYPLSKTSSFTGYTSAGFSAADHWKLRGVFGSLVEAGVKVILSNSSAEEVRTMYSGFDVKDLVGSRSIGGPASYRRSVKEVMISGPVRAPKDRPGTRPSSG